MRPLAVFVGVLVAALGASAADAFPLDEAAAAEQVGDFAKARRIYRATVTSPNPLEASTADFALGELFRNGRGVTRDSTEAAKWYRDALQHEPLVSAAFQLARLLEAGDGLPQDLRTAYFLFDFADISEASAPFQAALLEFRQEIWRHLASSTANLSGAEIDHVHDLVLRCSRHKFVKCLTPALAERLPQFDDLPLPRAAAPQ